MKKGFLRFLVFLILGILFLAPASQAREDSKKALVPLEKMRDSVLAFFKPAEAEVVNSSGGLFTGSIGNAPGFKEGMRFRVLRKGIPFLHPVTHEPVANIEEDTGMAELEKITGDTGYFKVLEGEAKPGDYARISNSKVRLLFYQLRNVGWALSEEYFELLKKSGRFGLLTTALDNAAGAMPEAKRLKADAVLVLSQSKGEDGKTVLNQKLLWASDGKEFQASSTALEPEAVKELTVGEELFTPKGDTATTFHIPFASDLIGLADVRGDGTKELFINSGKKLLFYDAKEAALEPTLGEGEIERHAGDEYLHFDSVRPGKGKKEDIVVTAMNGGHIISYIYAFDGSKFKEVWTGKELFLRTIGGKLYGQKFDSDKGYSGPVMEMAFRSGMMKETGKRLKLPEGVNIYDFSYMDEGGKRYIVAFNDADQINLYTDKGMLIWYSKKSFGGFLKKFKKNAPTVMVDRGEWSVKDPILVRGKDVIIVKRKPLVGMAMGLGYKDSAIKTLRWNGNGFDELDLVKEIHGTIYDYAISGNNLLVIASPILGMEFKKILQGESPVTRFLYMYPLEE